MRRKFGQLLFRLLMQNRSWVGVDRVFYLVDGRAAETRSRVLRSPPTNQFSLANGTAESSSARNDIGRMLTSAEKSSGPIIVDGAQVGTLLFFDYVSPEEAAFLASAERSALVGGGITTALALAISIFFIAQILSPLRTLTRATESIAEGRAPEKVLLRSRDEIGQLGESFDHMVDNLRRSERLRQTMTADIAHELRTPVTIIQGTLEAVLDGVYEPTRAIADLRKRCISAADRRSAGAGDGRAGELRLNRAVDIGQLVDKSSSDRPALKRRDHTIVEAIEAMVDRSGSARSLRTFEIVAVPPWRIP
jgi:signal transduction histidine kinase